LPIEINSRACVYQEAEKMASKAKLDLNILRESIVPDDLVITDFCHDCLFSWCALRNNVTYCSMKSKGFFECKSCIAKLVK